MEKLITSLWNGKGTKYLLQGWGLLPLLYLFNFFAHISWYYEINKYIFHDIMEYVEHKNPCRSFCLHTFIYPSSRCIFDYYLWCPAELVIFLHLIYSSYFIPFCTQWGSHACLLPSSCYWTLSIATPRKQKIGDSASSFFLFFGFYCGFFS